ncbi:response regulator [Candidiatus Paracoxiella cheracis]|uniref:response regulator n=1 Tax=Candidiatus Paracoxiella cheracis TaxID=3405120 RepID=UPI003BF5B317
MIRIALIEDHVVVRQALKVLLSQARGMQVIGEAATGQEGLAMIKAKHPDVVILDFRLPDTDGLEMTQKIMRFDPDIKVLVMTAVQSNMLAQRLLSAGVHGYLTKENSTTELETAIRRVHSGQPYISPDIANQLALQRINPNQKNPFDILSKREMQVLLLLAKGIKPQAIAEKLFISPKTVNSYRYRLFEKLNVKTDVALINLAIRYGLVDVDGI